MSIPRPKDSVVSSLRLTRTSVPAQPYSTDSASRTAADPSLAFRPGSLTTKKLGHCLMTSGCRPESNILFRRPGPRHVDMTDSNV